MPHGGRWGHLEWRNQIGASTTAAKWHWSSTSTTIHLSQCAVKNQTAEGTWGGGIVFSFIPQWTKKKKDWTKRDKLSALDAMEESNANKVSGYILLLTFWGCACGWATQLHHHRPNQVTLLSRLRSGEDPSISLGSDRKYNIITESDTVIACLTFGIVTDAHG